MVPSSSPAALAVVPQAPEESGLAQAAAAQGLLQGDFFFLPGLHDVLKAGGHPDQRAAHGNAPGLGRGDALGLAAADALPLALGHKGENLQHQVGDERPHQVLPLTGIQEGHIQHGDVHLLLLRQQPPLVLDFLIISSQAVDALDIEQIARPEPLYQLLILRPGEILA